MSKEYSHPGQTGFPTFVLYILGKFIYKLFYKIEVVNSGDFTKVEGPVLILSKHSSNHDIPIGYPAVVDQFKRNPWCIIKKELTKPMFFGFFLKAGGVPIDRKNPEKSKDDLLFARKVLYDGNILIIFPEQTRCPGKMNRGKLPGFRFITGKPKNPLPIVVMGVEYRKSFFRTKVTLKFGKIRLYQSGKDPAEFLHEAMIEMASLSNLEYPYKLEE